MADINSCSLPSPRILSAAGEVTHLIPGSHGSALSLRCSGTGQLFAVLLQALQSRTHDASVRDAAQQQQQFAAHLALYHQSIDACFIGAAKPHVRVLCALLTQLERPIPPPPMRQVTKLSPANAGVIYLNLTAWQELHSDLMHYAELHGWLFPNADQARFQRRCSLALPDLMCHADAVHHADAMYVHTT